MPSDFHKFSNSIHTKWERMKKKPLFKVNLTKEEVWLHYLCSFPEGSDPTYKTNTEHDCSCCRQFIKTIGLSVNINGTELDTVWDADDLEYPYDEVAKSMAKLVRDSFVSNKLFTKETKYGQEATLSYTDDGVKTFYHFRGVVPPACVTGSVGEKVGQWASKAKVFERGLEELTYDSLITVLDLCEQNNLYRGEEFKKAVKEFLGLKEKYRKLNDPKSRNRFVWANVDSHSSLIKNTVIGTLLEDLSKGTPADEAVRLFESKVAPTNYKRPKAIVTEKMVKSAIAKLDELNLRESIERRHATLQDISINNVVWASANAKPEMKDSLVSLLVSSTKTPKVDIKNTQEISVEDFIKDELPRATSLQALVQNDHSNNFVSITAPKHKDSISPFYWGNGFAWSYDGEVTDSIRDKVSKAGGKVKGATLRASLAWFNGDDLDLHMQTPYGRIYFGNKQGKLDVDMNAGGPTNKVDPVENVSFTGRLKDGLYTVQVNNFKKRSSQNVGFTLEVEHGGVVRQYSYPYAVPNKVTIDAFTLKIKDNKIVHTNFHNKDLTPMSEVSADKWGIKTNTLTEVDTVMFSPNYWDGQEKGNKHYFFLLKDCVNPEPVRGIYNEYLKPELQEHRKVFELLGSKTKCEPSSNQLSGVGFSSTQSNTLKVIAKGDNFSKAFTIKF